MMERRMMDGNRQALSYVLITPARDEEVTLEDTIRSVESQTVLPVKWIIVSDGSTDRTDEIIQEYCRKHSWIGFVRLQERQGRQFAAKVQAFNAGYEQVRNIDYDIIGNLDADITFDPEYLEFLLDRFRKDPQLGVAGTPFVEEGSRYDYRFTNIEHVSGACQLFRRACFEEIGGYLPIKGGGIDWTAVTTARMKGWHTRTFPEKVSHHHRKMSSGNSDGLGIWFRRGGKDYFLGGHPAWQLFRSIYQMKRRPYLIGGSLLLLGYGWAWLTRMERSVSPELMKFHRNEQMNRLKAFPGRFRRRHMEQATP